jgi:ABC-2 type transport system ATP-binding protein
MNVVRCDPTSAEFSEVSKWYGPVIALNGVSVRLGPGTTGLVGPNGAGKTTFMKLLTGLLRPSLGEVRVGNTPAWSSAAKRHIGYCPDVSGFYEELSGRTFVRTMARLRGVPRRTAADRTDEVLDLVGMSERADRSLGAYSKGMRQRIKLAQALVHDPDFLVLDEPLDGVDPVGRVELVELFGTLARSGKTVLVSSHVLDEMDALDGRILFLRRGRIVASGSLEEVRAMLDSHPLKIRVTTSRAREMAAKLISLDAVEGVDIQTDRDLLLKVRQSRNFFKVFGQIVVEEDFAVEVLRVMDTSTEAVFDYLLESTLYP